MSWGIEHLADGNVVVVRAEGRVSTEDAFKQVVEGVGLILRTGAGGAWIDYSAAILEMPIVDIFKMPDLFEAQGLPRATKIGITLPSDRDNMHKYTFFDDVASNRGYIVRLFWEEGQALKWLTRTTPERAPRKYPD
jgi:hypothetical protein